MVILLPAIDDLEWSVRTVACGCNFSTSWTCVTTTEMGGSQSKETVVSPSRTDTSIRVRVFLMTITPEALPC